MKVSFGVLNHSVAQHMWIDLVSSTMLYPYYAGNGDKDVLSLDYYEKRLTRIELYQKLNDARDEFANGAKGTEARAFRKSMMKA